MEWSLEIPRLIRFENLSKGDGQLFSLEQGAIPFEPKRTYFMVDWKQGAVHGRHAHVNMGQVLIAIRGSFSVDLTDKRGVTQTFVLGSPDRGLFVPPGYWRVVTLTNGDGILLALASSRYEEADYVRDLSTFLGSEEIV